MHQHQYFQSATINAKRKEQAQNVDTFFTTRNFHGLLIKLLFNYTVYLQRKDSENHTFFVH